MLPHHLRNPKKRKAGLEDAGFPGSPESPIVSWVSLCLRLDAPRDAGKMPAPQGHEKHPKELLGGWPGCTVSH